MEGEIAVNTSSLIYIAKLDIFNLAKNMFSRFLVPREVIEEIFEKEEIENNLIKKELNKFIKEIEINKIRDFNLHKGEKAAISLCLEKGLPFLSDDKKARKIAHSLGIEFTGVLGILIWNLEHKKIGKKECRELIKKLIGKGYYMNPSLYDEVRDILDDCN